MVVKSKVGRKRYIIFKINSDMIISKRDLIFTLNKLISDRLISKESSEMPASGISQSETPDLSSKITLQANNSKYFTQMPWIIDLANNFGLIRCHHLDKDITIKLLQSIEWAGRIRNCVRIETLGTTGTIRAARKKYLDKITLYPSNNPKTK